MKDIGNVEISLSIDHQAIGAVHSGSGGVTAISTKGFGSAACDRCDHATRCVDLSYAIVAGVGNVDVAGHINGDAGGTVERSQGTVTAVAGRWGFLHAGRFAAAYKAAYGHPPSETPPLLIDSCGEPPISVRQGNAFTPGCS